MLVADRVAYLDQAIGQPVAEPVAIERRHRDVDVGLELQQPLARVGDGTLAHALELDAVPILERAREPDDVVGVHLEAERVARVADDLVLYGNGPIAFGRLADDDHRTAIVGVPRFHSLERVEDLSVVVAVGDVQDVPAVRRPLIAQPVVLELRMHHAANQRIVDARVVVGEKDPEALADLHGDGLCLQLLGVAGGHRKFAFERDDLRRAGWSTDEIPERRFARGGRDADARRPAVDVVGDVGRLDVARQRADAAAFRLREARVIGEAGVFQEIFQRARAAAEAERVDREHRGLGRDVVAAIAGRLELPRERLAEDHPQRVARGRAVAGGQHELVAVRVLWAAIVVVQSAAGAAGEMRGDVERRVRQRSAEMPGLRVVAEQHERHAGHETDVLQVLEVAPVGRLRSRKSGCGHGQRFYTTPRCQRRKASTCWMIPRDISVSSSNSNPCTPDG